MSTDLYKPKVGISVGDINGIGIEVILKTFSNSDVLEQCTPIIFANAKVIIYQKKMYKSLNLNFNSITSFDEVKSSKINVFNCWTEDVQVELGKETSNGGKYALRSLEVASQCLKDGQIDALVTAPISKHNTYSKSFEYHGHTHYLQDFFHVDDVAMILFTDNLRVSPLTDHIALGDVPAQITRENISKRLDTIIKSLEIDFGIEKPKIAVLGLNPHNGDKGLYGKEEIEVIYPVIEEYREKGNIVVGPFSADSFFARNQYKKFDLTLGMYHDQVLIPFKYMDGGQGVNFTAGLPYIRTSPDHGTAFDIAGKDMASADSMRAAVFQCIDLYRNRKSYENYTQGVAVTN